MPCTCNAICDNDCAANNNVCTGNEPVCANDYSFTVIAAGTVILDNHINELETAINNERTDATRRYNASDPSPCASHTSVACSTNDWAAYAVDSPNAADLIEAANFDKVIAANNEVVTDSGFGTSIALNPNPGDLITAADIQTIQSAINGTRDACICDSHCSCDPADCGCNGECPSDDYYYYYYP